MRCCARRWWIQGPSRNCWSWSWPGCGNCVAAAFAVPVSSGLPTCRTGGLRSESDADDQPASDDDPVAPHRPQGAGSGSGAELARLAAPAARAADLIPGPQRGLRPQDRAGLECDARWRRLRHSFPGRVGVLEPVSHRAAPLLGVSKSAADRVIDHLGPMLALQPRRRFAKGTVLIVDGAAVPTRGNLALAG